MDLTAGGSRIPAWKARPEAAGRVPVVLVLPDFDGNSELHRDVVRRFAPAGDHAISPELFPREDRMQGKTVQEMGRTRAASPAPGTLTLTALGAEADRRRAMTEHGFPALMPAVVVLEALARILAGGSHAWQTRRSGERTEALTAATYRETKRALARPR